MVECQTHIIALHLGWTLMWGIPRLSLSGHCGMTAGMHKAHLTDHDIVHELVQREVQRCSRKVSLLTGALAVEVAPPREHPVVVIIPLE